MVLLFVVVLCSCFFKNEKKIEYQMEKKTLFSTVNNKKSSKRSKNFFHFST